MFFVVGDFTLRLLENVDKNDSAQMRFVNVARAPEREKK